MVCSLAAISNVFLLIGWSLIFPNAAQGQTPFGQIGIRLSIPNTFMNNASAEAAMGPSVEIAKTIPAASSSQGRTYYVSPHGKDSNPGTLNSPWASPGFASRRLKPGDTLMIMGGRYVLSQFDEDILSPPSGTSKAWITIKGKEGNRPILAGQENLATAIILSGVHYVRIENLEITHNEKTSGEGIYFREGIQILEKPASHLVLKDLYIHHLDEFGLNFQDVKDLKIINCRIEYCGFGAIGGPAREKGGWQNILIQGCKLSYSGHYYQGGDGSKRPYDRPDGFGIEASAGPIKIIDTFAAHNFGDGLDSKAENTLILRSVAANNSCDGIKLWGDRSRIENSLIYGRGDGNTEKTPWAAIVLQTEKRNARFEIIHVTVDDILGGNYLMHVQYDQQDLPITLTLRNNIFRGAGPNCPIFIGHATNLKVENNLFYFPQSDTVFVHGEKEFSAETIKNLGKGNIYGDPLFISPAWGKEGNYHVKSRSPAVNAGGHMSSVSDDLEKKARDNQPDMGAYELGL